MSAWLFILILRAVLFSDANGIIRKARLCIQYEIKDYNSSLARLKTLNGTSRGGCFMKCVRHLECRAFQFHPNDGLCELLPEVACMAENKTAGINLVGLSECHFLPLWKPVLPTNGNWQWVTDPPTLDKTIELKSRRGARRKVGRVLYQGLYLPGYERNSRFNSAGPDGVRFFCKSEIQYLIFEDPSHYSWQSFHVGDPVPHSAIIGGYWPQDTPLYILKVFRGPNDSVYAFYYNAKSKAVYPEFVDMHPEMAILVSTV